MYRIPTMDNGEKNYGFVDDDRTNSTNSFSAAISSTEQLTQKDKDNVYTVELKNLGKSLESEEYDPYAHRKVERPTTNIETILHLIKGSLGTGILAMPLAFYHSGWLLGLILTALIGSLCTYCIHMLIKCEYELCKRNKLPSLTYPSLVEKALLEGPPFFRRIASYSPHIVNIFTMIYQLGICCVYTVFIGENTHIVLKDLWMDIDARWIMLAFLLPLILINYIKSLKFLAPLSTIAIFLTLISFGIIVYYLAKQGMTLENRQSFGNYRDYPLFFGTVLFALEAIGVILPLENEMKSPKSFGGSFGILNTGMVFIVIVYIAMGFFGYLAYGKNVGGSISYTIGTEIPAEACKLILVVAIFISYSLQMYVAVDITWNQYLQPKLEKNPYQNIYEYIVRTFLVVFCFALAVTVPYVDLFISLFGALSLSAIGLAIPAVVDVCTYWNSLTGIRGCLVIAKNCFVAAIGLFGLTIGTWTSLEKIAEKFM